MTLFVYCFVGARHSPAHVLTSTNIHYSFQNEPFPRVDPARAEEIAIFR